MKTLRFFSPIAAFMVCYISFGQNTDILEYNFRCKNLSFNGNPVTNINDVKAKYNKEFRVRVTNVNRYNYSIGISLNDIEFGSTQPELFKTLFLGDGGLVTDLIKDYDIASIDEQLFTIKEPISELLKDFSDFENHYNKLIDSQIEAYSLYQIDTIICSSTSKRKELFSDLAKNLQKLNFDCQKLQNRAGIEIERLTDSLTGFRTLLESVKKTKSILTDKTDRSRGKNKIDLENESDNLDKKITELQDKIKTYSEEVIIAQKTLSSIQFMTKSLSKYSEEKLIKLTLFNNNLVDEHFTYTSPPIFPRGSRLNIGLDFSPSDSSLIRKWNIMPLVNDSIEFQIFVKNKWFVSFSSGPFFGIGNHLRSETYGWKPSIKESETVVDTSNYILVSTGKGNAPAGIAAFANLGTKLSDYLGFGFSMGVGITIEENPDASYFLGGSIYIGERGQFNLTGGLIMAQVEKLKSELYDLETTKYSGNLNEIEYTSELKAGIFFSLSYTIFSYERYGRKRSGSK